MGRRSDPAFLIRVAPAVQAQIRELAAVYREAGVPTSATGLVERYMFEGLLRDGYGAGGPPSAACAPEAVAGLSSALTRQPLEKLIKRIRERRGTLLRQAAASMSAQMRDPEVVAAELAEVQADEAAEG